MKARRMGKQYILDTLVTVSSSATMALFSYLTLALPHGSGDAALTICYIRFWRRLPAVEHRANPMVLTGAWVAQVLTEEQLKLHEDSPHVNAIHLGHIGV